MAPCSSTTTWANSRWTSKPIRRRAIPPLIEWEPGGQHNTNGFALAAHPGSVAGAANYKYGLAAHCSSTACPSCVLPGAPYPDGFTIAELSFSRQLTGGGHHPFHTRYESDRVDLR